MLIGGPACAAKNCIHIHQNISFIQKWCYLCKLKILSSSYGSSRAATNAFQDLKIVKFADPFLLDFPCQKLTILPQTFGLHFNFQMKEVYILPRIVVSSAFKGCLRSPRSELLTIELVVYLQKVHQRLCCIMMILGRLSLQQQFRSGKRMSICQMHHEMYKVATISCKGKGNKKEKILEQGHTVTKLQKSKQFYQSYENISYIFFTVLLIFRSYTSF